MIQRVFSHNYNMRFTPINKSEINTIENDSYLSKSLVEILFFFLTIFCVLKIMEGILNY